MNLEKEVKAPHSPVHVPVPPLAGSFPAKSMPFENSSPPPHRPTPPPNTVAPAKPAPENRSRIGGSLPAISATSPVPLPTRARSFLGNSMPYERPSPPLQGPTTPPNTEVSPAQQINPVVSSSENIEEQRQADPNSSKRAISISSGDGTPKPKRRRRLVKWRPESSSDEELLPDSPENNGKGKGKETKTGTEEDFAVASTKPIELEMADESNTFLDQQENMLQSLTEEER